jgi:hypothetical protein
MPTSTASSKAGKAIVTGFTETPIYIITSSGATAYVVNWIWQVGDDEDSGRPGADSVLILDGWKTSCAPLPR